MPDFKTAEIFNKKLAKRFNLASDGRPILGMDAKHLLNELLETSEDAFMIPAHLDPLVFSAGLKIRIRQLQ